jgi:hypothetical protein
MSKVIEFPTKEKRMERLLREQLPLDLPSDVIEKLADELREAAEKIDERPKSFNLMFPHTYSQGDMEFVTRQVEEIVGELMSVIKGEEGEIFNLIIRYHLLLHEARRRLDS